MALTSIFKFDMPDWKTLRYDQGLNLDLQKIEDALMGFPSVHPPGSDENYPEITLSNGLKWLDTGNDLYKMYYEGEWVTILDLPSVSTSTSPSISASRSSSVSASRSASRSPSVSASRSASISPSVSASISASASISPSVSESISSSVSESSSPSA